MPQQIDRAAIAADFERVRTDFQLADGGRRRSLRAPRSLLN